MSTRHVAPNLTRRERDVLALLVRGCSDKEICARLHIAYGTLRTHVSRLYADFGVSNRAALIARWHRLARTTQALSARRSR